VFDRAREDADRFIRGDDAAVRSVSGAAPCGRKESGDDRGRVGCRGGRDRGGGCGRIAVAESASEGEKQDLTQKHNDATDLATGSHWQIKFHISKEWTLEHLKNATR